MFREVGDRQLTAFTLGRLGGVVHDRGDTERAAALLEQESLPLFRMIGDTYGLAYACSILGRVMKDRGAYERAEALYEESLALRREIEDTFGVAEALGRLAELRRLQQAPEQAAVRYRESLQLRRDLGDKGGLVACLEGLAYLAALIRVGRSGSRCILEPSLIPGSRTRLEHRRGRNPDRLHPRAVVHSGGFQPPALPSTRGRRLRADDAHEGMVAAGGSGGQQKTPP